LFFIILIVKYLLIHVKAFRRAPGGYRDAMRGKNEQEIELQSKMSPVPNIAIHREVDGRREV
jgi:hypothetical protein